MPTPVATAKQCLTEESARVLDDAVSVARRRCHAQTTSLHAVSALLSLPSSFLREACSRIRSPAYYSSRFQFRALDLCVGVSLDRLQSSKSGSSGDDNDPPPVSNSLMAAIKRSQASQRRMPEMYQITHAASSIYSISTIKVELKNFVISVLDDPIVSRVLGDAGFRSTDIKLAILHPPAPNPPPSRYFRGAGGRCPPLFLCNLTDSRPSLPGNIPFPFSRGDGVDCDGDENCRRIDEVLAKISGRNPLLVGVCARDALVSFKKRVENGKVEGVLPGHIAGLDLICVEKDISEFISNGGSKEAFDLKVEEMRSALENNAGPGLVVNFGELKVLVEAEGVSDDYAKCLVEKLSSLIRNHRKKMWLIGSAVDYETYRKFLNRFPLVEVDWDLHPLPITSSRSSATELYSKSSLMGSFVPFGGFFSTPSNFRVPMSITNKPFTRCNMCNERYEQELSAITSRGCSVAVADQQSSSLPSWLQMANSDVSKTRNGSTEIIDEKAESSAQVSGLQKKWDGICQRFHQGPEIPRPAPSISNHAVPCDMGLHYIADQRSRRGTLHSNEGLRSNLDSSVSAMVQNTSAQEHNIKASLGSFRGSFDSQTKSDPPVSNSSPHKVDGAFLAQSSCNLNLAPDHVSSSPISCVTTDLGLGTSASASQELKKPDSHLNSGQLQSLSCSISTERPVHEKSSNRIFPYSSPAGPELRCQLRDGFDQGGDCKLIVQKLTEKVVWQTEACCDVGQIISRRRSGGEHIASDIRHDTWIAFVGPDKMGKKKMAEALAELMFGSKENLIAVDLSVQQRKSESHLVFDSRLPNDTDMRTGRKTVADYIAGELRKKPRSVVFLENVDETDDPLAQRILLHAIRTGKLPDSLGREISIVNAIFLIALNSTGEDQVHSNPNTTEKFSEQRILNALSRQMKIVVEHAQGEEASTNKRRQNDTDEPFRSKKLKGFLDLNIPLEEDTEEINEMETNTISDSSRVWLQDFLGQIQQKVAFKPFNFDALANKLLNKMNLSLQRTLGSSGFRLEVDQEVMTQILAAALCSNGDGPVDDWIKEVLIGACVEAQRRFNLHEPTGLKLVSCTGLPVDKQAPGIRLPRVINLG